MIAGVFAGGEVVRWGLRNTGLSFFCGKVWPLVQHKPGRKLPTEDNMRTLSSAIYLLKAHLASETADEEIKNHKPSHLETGKTMHKEYIKYFLEKTMKLKG